MSPMENHIESGYKMFLILTALNLIDMQFHQGCITNRTAREIMDLSKVEFGKRFIFENGSVSQIKRFGSS